jgi:hypothetical protein
MSITKNFIHTGREIKCDYVANNSLVVVSMPNDMKDMKSGICGELLCRFPQPTAGLTPPHFLKGSYV